MSLEWYRSFVAVYQAGTVSSAARSLFLTQPAVTQHVAALETLVGEPLFIRTPRQMVPTIRGKELYCQVVHALEILDVVSQNLHERPINHMLRCGIPREYFRMQALEHFLQLPSRLRFQFGETPALIKELEQGQLDIVIATQQVPSPEIYYLKIGEEQLCLVGASTFAPLPSPKSEESVLACLETWFSEQKWVSYGVELPLIRRFWQQSFGKRPTFTAALIVPDLQAIAWVLQQQSTMISVLPLYLCEEALITQSMRILWKPPRPVTNDLWFAARKAERNHIRIKQLYTLFLNFHLHQTKVS